MSADPDPARLRALRADHLLLRNAGYVVCLIGTMVMVSGRFMPGAPQVLMYAGVSGIVFGWGLLGFAHVKRVAHNRALAPRGGTVNAKS